MAPVIVLFAVLQAFIWEVSQAQMFPQMMPRMPPLPPMPGMGSMGGMMQPGVCGMPGGTPCFGTTYDPVHGFCCDNKPFMCPADQASQWACCGKRLVRKQPNLICCNGDMHMTSPVMQLRCCDKKVINPQIYHCCNGERRFKPRGEPKCCDNKAYNSLTQVCCNREVVNIANIPYNMACNGFATADPHAQQPMGGASQAYGSMPGQQSYGAQNPAGAAPSYYNPQRAPASQSYQPGSQASGANAVQQLQNMSPSSQHGPSNAQQPGYAGGQQPNAPASGQSAAGQSGAQQTNAAASGGQGGAQPPSQPSGQSQAWRNFLNTFRGFGAPQG